MGNGNQAIPLEYTHTVALPLRSLPTLMLFSFNFFVHTKYITLFVVVIAVRFAFRFGFVDAEREVLFVSCGISLICISIYRIKDFCWRGNRHSGITRHKLTMGAKKKNNKIQRDCFGWPQSN